MNNKKTFADILIKLREESGLTQQQLADELKITRQSLSLYEKSERTINIELFADIASFFNVSADYLLGRTETKTLNENIQGACKVTGLSEKAVKMLNEEVKHISENPENNESRRCLEIISELIANYYLWSISTDLQYLESNSKALLNVPQNIDITFLYRILEVTKIPVEMVKEYLEDRIKGDKSTTEQKEKNDLVTECDVTRYTITRIIEEISDKYDHREDYKNYNKQQLIEYLNLKPLLEQIEKEGQDHGKHNQKE